ncbi:MAG: hypothetical protein R3F10_02535 [Lysobacteraceae bacterium]
MSNPPIARSIFHACLVGVFAVAGLAGLWAAASVFLRGPCAFMAVVATVDVALLLRLSAFASGRARAVAGLVIVAVAIPVGLYVAAVASIGRVMGVLPHKAFALTSPEFAALWLRFNLGWMDALWVLAGLVLAWRLSR